MEIPAPTSGPSSAPQPASCSPAPPRCWCWPARGWLGLPPLAGLLSDAPAQSAALLIFGVGLAFAAFLWWLAARSFALLRDPRTTPEQLASLRELPLALPEGTVRALLALIVGVVGLPLLLFSQALVAERRHRRLRQRHHRRRLRLLFRRPLHRRRRHRHPPPRRSARRQGGRHAEALREENAALKDRAAPKPPPPVPAPASSPPRWTRSGARSPSPAPSWKRSAPLSPPGLLPAGAADALQRARTVAAEARALAEGEVDPATIARVVDAAAALSGRDGAFASLLRTAAGALPAIAGGGPLAAVSLLLGIGWQAGSAAWRRWRAQVLGAPHDPTLFDPGSITPVLGGPPAGERPHLRRRLRIPPRPPRLRRRPARHRAARRRPGAALGRAWRALRLARSRRRRPFRVPPCPAGRQRRRRRFRAHPRRRLRRPRRRRPGAPSRRRDTGNRPRPVLAATGSGAGTPEARAALQARRCSSASCASRRSTRSVALRNSRREARYHPADPAARSRRRRLRHRRRPRRPTPRPARALARHAARRHRSRARRRALPRRQPRLPTPARAARRSLPRRSARSPRAPRCLPPVAHGTAPRLRFRSLRRRARRERTECADSARRHWRKPSSAAPNSTIPPAPPPAPPPRPRPPTAPPPELAALHGARAALLLARLGPAPGRCAEARRALDLSAAAPAEHRARIGADALLHLRTCEAPPR